ncbi:MAG: VOC family protein [Deinococcota bacterium]
MTVSFGGIILYAKNVMQTAEFYETYFRLERLEPHSTDTNAIELTSPTSNMRLLILQAAKSVKQGQACIKLVFSVENVSAFREVCEAKGLSFGPIHQAEGYTFANAKDPNGNRVQISSRAFALD